MSKYDDRNYKRGEFFAELRKNKKLTQAELAEKLGVSDRAVSKWENGQCLPDIPQLKALSKLYNISIDELIIGEKKSQNTHEKALEQTLNSEKKYKNNSKKLMAICVIAFLLQIANVLLFFIGTDISYLLILILNIAVLFVNIIIISFLKFGNNLNYSKEKQIKPIQKKSGIIITHIIAVGLLIFSICGIIFDPAPVVWNIIWIVWALTISQAYAYIIILLKKQNAGVSFYMGSLVGSLGWVSLLLPILLAPILCVIYYIELIKSNK